MNFYQFIIARLNGKDIEKEFDYYIGLVKKGIAGFIIFGGELNTVRQGIKELQKEADERLIMASDLERGLGQQLEGGTIFPPAMAIASAITPLLPPLIRGEGEGCRVHNQKLKLLREVFKAVAVEARYAGINTIFAPVLDINTNPKNPIISTRAFGEDPESVSFFGCEMIKILQSYGITACGKHFPGHGDTETDSHIKLPKIKKDLKTLSKTELAPFRNAVKVGVKMIMLGHLDVPALNPPGIPVSLSQKTVGYLRNKLGFKGIIITDAMNMGGIGKYSEEEASLMALNAGVDILLHPADSDKVVSYLEKKDAGCRMLASGESPPHTDGFAEEKRRHDTRFKRTKTRQFIPDFSEHKRLAEKITRMAIKIDGRLKPLRDPLLIILSDDIGKKGKAFYAGLKSRYHSLKRLNLKQGEALELDSVLKGRDVIVAVFSGIKAWKGGASSWLLKGINKLEKKSEIFVSFGSPYLIDNIRDRIGDCPRFTDRAERRRRIGTVPAVKIYAYWDSDSAQKAVAEVIAQG